MSSLLDGIRVIESAILLNGDLAGMLLGDLGADVVKVEQPGTGDYIRDMLGEITPHNSPAHLQVNKNKRSVTVNLRSPEGKAVFWRLIDTADVFLDGNSPGTCDRLGIGYDDQVRRKPDIVYVSTSGFGVTGPMARIPTHGEMMESMAGAFAVRTDERGLLVRGDNTDPLGGTAIGGDSPTNAAMQAAMHVCAALVQRQRTGRGACIDVAGADATIVAGWLGALYNVNRAHIRESSSFSFATRTTADDRVKYKPYRTSDDRVVLFCCIEHRFFENFCRAVDRPDLLAHTDHTSPIDNASNNWILADELAAIFVSRTQTAWVELAIEHDFPVGPVNTIDDLATDPHLRSRQVLVDGQVPDGPAFTYIGSAAVVRDDPYAVRRSAPALSEHTDEVLAELGYDTEAIEELRRLDAV